VWDLIYPEDLSEVQNRFQAREDGGYPDLRYETRLVRSDGNAVWADVASTRMAFEGEISVQVNVSDITERKIAEHREREFKELAKQQEEQLVHSARLAELGELAASVAHEVNQPLTGIRNYARNAVYMIENQVGEREDLLDNLNRIAAQVDRAAQIIRLLQQLSRRSDREKEPIELNELLNECVEFLETKLRLAGVQVELDLDEDLPLFTGDRIRIEQVFLNLLTNALHALDQVERRRLVIRTSREADERLMIEFSDSGVGFENSDRQKLFRPFYTTKQNGQGTGLGLPISLSVVEEHHGTIEANGELGQGATFKIRLPIGPQNKERSSHECRPE
jgi:C4-dicarboxylate-specific signal transduction histidine kinase